MAKVRGESNAAPHALAVAVADGTYRGELEVGPFDTFSHCFGAVTFRTQRLQIAKLVGVASHEGWVAKNFPQRDNVVTLPRWWKHHGACGALVLVLKCDYLFHGIRYATYRSSLRHTGALLYENNYRSVFRHFFKFISDFQFKLYLSLIPTFNTMEKLVGFFAKLRRGYDAEILETEFDQFLQSTDPKVVANAIVMMFQTRDPRGGKGERDLFVPMMLRLAEVYPDTADELVPLVPEYGRFKDLVDLWIAARPRRETIGFELEIMRFYTNALRAKNGLAAKWLPGSKRSSMSEMKTCHIFRRYVRDLLFGLDPQASKKLRKLVSACNRESSVVKVQIGATKTTGTRYDPVRRVLSNSREKVLAQYTFAPVAQELGAQEAQSGGGWDGGKEEDNQLVEMVVAE